MKRTKTMPLHEIQRALMGLSSENQEKFYEQRNIFLEQTDFNEPLMDEFDHYRVFIGSQTNEIALGITAASFNTVFFSKTIGKYSLGNMMSICQASESVTFGMYIMAYGPSTGITSKWAYWRENMERLTEAVNVIIEPELQKMLKSITLMQQSLIRTNGNSNNYKNPNTIHLPNK